MVMGISAQRVNRIEAIRRICETGWDHHILIVLLSNALVFATMYWLDP